MAVIDRAISNYIIFKDDSINEALRKISLNKCGFVVAVSEQGQVEGILTDGDFRLWVISTPEIDLQKPTGSIINRDFKWVRDDRPSEDIQRLFSNSIKFVPVLDSSSRLVGVAFAGTASVKINKFSIDASSPAFVIAEIGNNHNGNLATAKRLVDEAVKAGADCAKFQMRQLDALYSNNGNSDDAREDLGSQYTLDLLTRFQLSNDEMFEIFDYCKQVGILPLCTPWDPKSLELLQSYGMEAYKVASADLTNHDFLHQLAATKKPLICSTGMSTEEEIRAAVKLLRSHNAQFVMLHCNSTYPTPFKDVNLSYMKRLSELSENVVGYSGHERGYQVVLAAIALGAKVIEKHFTLDKTWEGNDHKVSLVPEEFASMVKCIRDVEESMGVGDSRSLSQGELMNREILAKSLVANRDIREGDTIEESMVSVKSPGKGLAPYRRAELTGKKALRSILAGDFFYPSDLNLNKESARPFRFNRPFGIPVRYHDMQNILKGTNLDLVEFHLSYKDLELEIPKIFSAQTDMDFVVHSPELFAGDHIMDLASSNYEYRRRSMDELQRVIEVTRQLAPYFRNRDRVPIIINAGGFTMDRHMAKEERKGYYELILKSLAELDLNGVEILPQTMPPFPWHFGGQRFQNLFMDPWETADFCDENNMRICLDVSHSKLACNYFKWSFSEFVQLVGPYTAHVHVVDAKGVDGEGLQIHEGEIDFAQFVRDLKSAAPSASFIPEIWQGHKNGGEGFWIALDRLERLGF